MSRTYPAFVPKYSVNDGDNVALICQPTCFECFVNLFCSSRVFLLFDSTSCSDEQESYQASASIYVPTRDDQPDVNDLSTKLFS